jgi:hypothetical protein
MKKQIRLFFYKIRYYNLSLAFYLSNNKKLLSRKILVGSMIVALFTLPACHSKKKTMCYYLYSPPANEKGMAMMQPEQNNNPKEVSDMN